MRQQTKSEGEGVKRLTRQTSRLKAIVGGSFATDRRSDPRHGNGAPSRCRSAVLFATLRGSLRAEVTGAPPAPRARLALAALLVVVAACLAPGVALGAKAHVYQSSFGPDCTSATQLEGEGPAPLAVDQQSGDIYVVDARARRAGNIVRCGANGTPDDFTAGPGAGTNEIGGFSFETLQGVTQIAVDSSSHAFYVADSRGPVKAFEGDGASAIFTAGPSAGSNEVTSFGGNPVSPADGVAVDANGDIYVSNGVPGSGAGAVDVLAPTGEELASFATIEPTNLAVNSHGDVYVSSYVFGAKGVRKFSPSAFPVTPATTYAGDGVVDPEAAFAIAIDPSNDDLYAVEQLDLFHSQIRQFHEDDSQVTVFPAPGDPGPLEYGEGVAIDAASGNVYASDARGEHQVEIFAPAPQVPPTIESSTVTNVITTSADLQAQINPQLFDTHYHFEYLTDAQYEANGNTFAGAQSTGSTDLGVASSKPQGAHAHISGLTPDMTYRFRVVGENENGIAASPEPAPSFSTFAAFAPGLPDGRLYELVSPTHKVGEVIPPAPENGVGGSCIECLPGIGANQLMPMQSAPDGDAVAYIGQPFSAGLASGSNEYLAHRSLSNWETQPLSSPLFAATAPQGYNAFSSDLSRSVILQVEPALSPQAPTRGGKSFANLYLRDEAGALQPLVTTEPRHRNPGLYGPAPEIENGFHIVYAGANSGAVSVPAFSHIVFEANDALTPADPPNAPAAPVVGAAESNLYEWVGGQLRLVNVLPGNAVALPRAVIGSGLLLADEPEVEADNFDHAISADGSRIFWSDGASGQVYVRIDGKETRELKDHAGKFLTASADGSKALLSDGCLYDVAAEACEADLTQGQGGFEGILGAGEDLSHVYFVDTAVLTGGQENANNELAEAGQFNLYSWSHGAPAFIGRLLGDDNGFNVSGRYGDWKASRANRVAQVSPDGTHLAFTSAARLTGYDNEPDGSGAHCGITACLEVFEYEAASGGLTCASCNPTGQRPIGQSNLSLIFVLKGLPPFRQPGNLSADGRLFFESGDVLSPRDTNGRIQDVYEWEPNGAGSCTRSRGCILLISSGHSANDSMFMDATPSGDDAFFITRQQLLPQDKDDQLDLYDARVDGGLSGGGETTPCGGEACKGPAAGSPPSQPPASSVFSGPGNFALTLTPKPNVAPKPLTRAQKLAKALKACAKKPKRKRRTCRAQAKKRYGPIKAKAKSKSHKGGK
jgi:hypothetical protein